MVLQNSMYTEENLHKLLDEVIDPELGIGIYSLGLIYKTTIHFDEMDKNKPIATDVVMTFTSPFCPYADAILEQVETTITLGGYGKAHIELSFNPPWQVPEHLRIVLGM